MQLKYQLDEFKNIQSILIDSDYDGTEPVGSLKEALSLLTIENPALTFSTKYKAGDYDDVPEYLVEKEAHAANILSDAWDSNPRMNALSILSRLMTLYTTNYRDNNCQ